MREREIVTLPINQLSNFILWNHFVVLPRVLGYQMSLDIFLGKFSPFFLNEQQGLCLNPLLEVNR